MGGGALGWVGGGGGLLKAAVYMKRAVQEDNAFYKKINLNKTFKIACALQEDVS